MASSSWRRPCRSALKKIGDWFQCLARLLIYHMCMAAPCAHAALIAICARAAGAPPAPIENMR
eukprot:1495895-Prorocentrum_lima.AAC.1